MVELVLPLLSLDANFRGICCFTGTWDTFCWFVVLMRFMGSCDFAFDDPAYYKK